ncbi:hypothetical protein SAMN05216522_102263 [Rosenbergiella nectarea]|uniref:Biofilm development protein YmgB/AriR n=1 Tax=Rosenbergiella nectarea TaxID=988801 RepID=A0A1H9FCH4_9GAMM|nr:biofilm development regulator YmgB/AriR family protein [Rosenbergiella nectarea]SEQ35629.1 hypothetical protein SAMN05216522_102263 [Rosenbergiella nectarea]
MRQQSNESFLAKQNNSFSMIENLSDDQLMGMLIVELLESGKSLNRKSICAKLMNCIELAENDDQIKRYQDLMLMVLERELN